MTGLLVVDEPRGTSRRVARGPGSDRLPHRRAPRRAPAAEPAIAGDDRRRDRARRARRRAPGVGSARSMLRSARGRPRRRFPVVAVVSTGCARRRPARAPSRARCVAWPSRWSRLRWSRRSTRCSPPMRPRPPSSAGARGSARSRCSLASRRAAWNPMTTCTRGSCTSPGWSTGPCAAPCREGRSPTRAAGSTTLTTKQRGLLYLLEAEGGVTAAAARARNQSRQCVRGVAAHRAPARSARHRRAAALRRER